MLVMHKSNKRLEQDLGRGLRAVERLQLCHRRGDGLPVGVAVLPHPLHPNRCEPARRVELQRRPGAQVEASGDARADHHLALLEATEIAGSVEHR